MQDENRSALSHVDDSGEASMVDVGEKPVVKREARASGFVRMKAGTVQLIRENGLKKGDVLAVARVAGIQAAKRTQDLIPLCHQIPLSFVGVEFEVREEGVAIECTARTTAQTGVEMEALSGASVAGLTIYDMCKAVDKEMAVENVTLISKTKENPNGD